MAKYESYKRSVKDESYQNTEVEVNRTTEDFQGVRRAKKEL